MKGALFIGWGEVIPGYREKALKVLNEALQYWGGFVKKGQVDGFEPLFLDFHGGDLSGFILVRGDRDKLSQLKTTPDFERLHLRSSSLSNLGVVDAFFGDEQQHRTAEYERVKSEIP